MRNILIAGPDDLFGSYLAAACLLNSDDRVFRLMPQKRHPATKEFGSLAVCAAEQLRLKVQTSRDITSLHSRIHSIFVDQDDVSPVNPIHQVWYVAGGGQPSLRRRGIRITTGETSQAIKALQKLDIGEFNYIGSAYGDWDSIPDGLVASQIPYRLFLTSSILGASHPLMDASYHDFLQFLAVLHELKAQIQERSTEYFEFQSLRYRGSTDAKVNLLQATKAADLIWRISRKPDTLGRIFEIANPEQTDFADFCELTGEAYCLGLLATDEDEPLNGIDLLFEARLSGFRDCLTQERDWKWKESCQAAGIAPEDLRIEEEELIPLLETIKKSQDADRQKRMQQAASLPGLLTKKTIQRGGSDLTYFVGGSTGSTVVLLNALGQEIHYWVRLMRLLMEQHRVLIWDPRGTVAPSRPFGLAEQVRDLEAVLENESVDTCHLVGWCTGPKVAVEFCLNHPEAVLSLVLLNMTFKCFGSPPELETIYEHNFEPLCQILKERPAMAASVMNSLKSSVAEDDSVELAEMEPNAMAIKVLSTMNRDLRDHVLAPFRTETTMLNYIHQVLDLWSYDMRSKAPQIDVPVLVIGSEYDRIASINCCSTAIPLFPNVRSLQIQGASHYCLYDYPDLIADLIETFFGNPEDTSAIYGEVRQLHAMEAMPV